MGSRICTAVERSGSLCQAGFITWLDHQAGFALKANLATITQGMVGASGFGPLDDSIYAIWVRRGLDFLEGIATNSTITAARADTARETSRRKSY